MKFTLVRTLGTDTETLGYLEKDGKHICYTLEDAVRDKKIKAETCIPYGEYKVKVTYSPRFNRPLPLIWNQDSNLSVRAANGDVWEGIRLHGGNTHLDTEGCPLVAYNQYINKPNKFTKSGKSYTVNNWIQGTAEKEVLNLLNDGKTHDLSIIHVDALKKETLYRLRNPMMKDDYIVKLQKALNKFGNNLVVDGWFGYNTHIAVMNFQSLNSLQVDGIVGKETAFLLNI